MPVYFGEMQLPDEPSVLPATVTIEQGRIRLNSGRTELGSWKLYEVAIRPRDEKSVIFRADGEDLILRLNEHDSFLAETAPYRRGEKRVQRERVHEAFRTDEEPGPSLVDDLRQDVDEVRQDLTKELSSVATEARELWNQVKSGPWVWVGLGVLVVLAIFLHGVATAVTLIGGLLALVVGALGLVEETLEERLPAAFNPIRLILVGAVLLVLGILLGIIF